MTTAGVPDRLSKILKPLGDVIVALFFDLDENEEVNRRGEDDLYSPFIYLMYAEQDNSTGWKKAKAAAQNVKGCFQNKFYNEAPGGWKNIELVDCEAISYQAMTVAQSDALKRWNGDYISLRADPQQPLPND